MVATVTDEQFAARELVRDWARSAAGIAAIREVEQGDVDAWRPVFAGLAELGLFGVAVSEDAGGAGGSVEDLCAMVEEAAKALVPGPVATTALATLVVTDADLLGALATGERFAGLALEGDVQFDGQAASGAVPWALGAAAGGVLLVSSGGVWLLVDLDGEGVVVEPLPATDFSRPLGRVTLTSAPAVALQATDVTDLAATLLAAEAAGVTRYALETAVAYAKVREQFGRPIGSFQAIKHICAEMLCRAEQAEVAAADAARAAGESDGEQFAIAAALAASLGIAAAKANVKDCIQVLGGIGCTWEHDAHLYLRRAHSIGRFLGGPQRWLRRVAALTQDGVRRQLSIDLTEVEGRRDEIAAAVAEVAALPADQRQAALAEKGLQAPHWPPPYGRGAGPAEQLLIDQELAAAG
ncbi:acyl-CoA dehydrogenase, partial [Mycobacterium kiyosense]